MKTPLLAITEKTYGRTHYAAQADVEAVTTGKRRMIPLRGKCGGRYSDMPYALQPKGGTLLHPSYLTGASIVPTGKILEFKSL